MSNLDFGGSPEDGGVFSQAALSFALFVGGAE